MKHHFLDQHSNLRSPVHALDPRVKIVALFSFLFFVIFTPITQAHKFVIYGALIFSIVMVSRVPLKFVLLRSLAIIPFVVLVAVGLPFLGGTGGSYNFGNFRVTYSAFLVFLNVLVKSWLCALAMISLVSTTSFSKLLNGFQRLKIPKVFIVILSFLYRYTFVFGDELLRMRKARDARAFNSGWTQSAKTVGCMIGALFVRSYERGEHIYTAMRSRGFNGEIRLIGELKLRRADILFLAVFFTLMASILAVG